jgi:hypothetical protein
MKRDTPRFDFRRYEAYAGLVRTRDDSLPG